MAGLLDDEALSASAVVANIAMNRERQLAGPNSYTRDLGFNPLDRLLARLTDAGELVADLDLTSIRGEDGEPLGRALTGELRRNGFAYDARRHRISLVGGRRTTFPYHYRGADDRAGPNYTGQPAVQSFYAPLSLNSGTLET
ncbi:hypothetical protein AB0J82_25630 [Asanoa sp. NPDC049518]|uniref:hypothetical protein n=1 Tax=unclassified Asanoa TaxID=2685164 RepID=UPI0034298953